MYFYCICGKEGDLRVLLFRHLLPDPKTWFWNTVKQEKRQHARLCFADHCRYMRLWCLQFWEWLPDPQITVKIGGPGPSAWDSNFLNLPTGAEKLVPSTGQFYSTLLEAIPRGQSVATPPALPAMLFFLNWGIVVLQCCVSFYRTAKGSSCAIQQVLISYLFYTY